MRTLVVLLGIFVEFCFVSICYNSKTGLRSVIVIYRHGDRAPNKKSFPKDTFHDEKYWPMGYGELTNKGKLRHYNLGKWMRKTYSLLPELYSSKDIYVLSTDFDRTLMSAGSNLAGLYPPKKTEIWNPYLPWQPIPIHTKGSKYDPVLYPFKKCLGYQKLHEKVDEEEYFKQINSNYSQLYKTLSHYTGWNIDKINYIAQLQSIFYAISEYNSSFLPSWYNLVNQKDIEYLAGVHYTKYTFTDELTKLGHGVFFNEILEHFDGVIRNGTDALKLLMFSAHQENIASILYWAGVFDYHTPKFASMLIWELYENENGHYINFKYKSNETYVHKLTFKGCGYNCEYKRFKDILTPFVLEPHERKRLCNIDK